MRQLLKPCLKPRLKPRLALLALGIVLSACTGSIETANPILLVTGYTSEAQTGHLGLIASSYGSVDFNENSLSFLPDSVRELPGLPVGYDILSRNEARGALAVLSRGPTAAGTQRADGFVSFYRLSGVNQDDPTNFTTLPDRPTLTLSALHILPDALNNIPAADLPFCPSDIQVSYGGQFAAILNVPQACGARTPPFIDIVNLSRAQLWQRITGVAAGPVVLEQRPAQDTLFYTVAQAGSQLLMRLTLPRPGAVYNPAKPLAAQQIGTLKDSITDSYVGLAPSSSDSGLIALFDRSVVGIESIFNPQAEIGDKVPTSRNNDAVLHDDLRETNLTLILGGTSGNRRFSVLQSLNVVEGEKTPEPPSGNVDAQTGVIEPNYSFAYFLSPVAGYIFDIENYGGSSPRAYLRDISNLPTDFVPAFVTWTRGTAAPEGVSVKPLAH